MSDSPARSPFQIATAELRALGIIITRQPGEYSVNFLNGKSDTAASRETLDEAIALGRDMAKQAPAAATKAANYRPKRRLSMRPKAVIKRRIKAHNRRLRARGIKEQRGQE
jgi:hypothetical protein